MATNQKVFVYQQSCKISSWTHRFDSLTELKFALSIIDDYVFLRDRLTIYYHPGTKQPVNNIKTFHRHYTPDFLIRHKLINKAFLTEIKPRAFADLKQLSLRQQVAENFIRAKGYDWKYKLIYDDEIILTAYQLERFEECLKLRTATERRKWFEELTRYHDQVNPCPWLPSSAQIAFVLFGTHPPKPFDNKE